jgi:hypothetical protein
MTGLVRKQGILLLWTQWLTIAWWANAAVGYSF